ncbi:MAG: NAD(P)H-binding protein, partial [Thermoleophilia bacterium]|nr:NAD(P)H-binding protein [Thermoleophilia bacterium]
ADHGAGAGRVAFVVGGTGVVGAEIVARLLDRGWTVRALARSTLAERALADAGAEAVPGNLLDASGDWRAGLARADLVVNAGLPRLSPPVRRRRLRRLGRRASDGARALVRAAPTTPIVAVSTTLVGQDLALARAAKAMEAELAGHPDLALVRLPWVYGASGPLAWVSQGVDARRYRIVGPGINRWPLISSADAAEAVLMAAALGSGIYTASEPDAPRQRELVEHLCATGGTPIPDHVPEALATFSLGAPLAAALSCDGRPEVSEALLAQGWHPSCEWRKDLLRLTRPEAAPEERSR